MKYKPLDKVRIKSLDWYNENKDENGIVLVENGDYMFCKSDTEWCGRIVTIKEICLNEYYEIKEDFGKYRWTDEMIEGLVEEENKDMDKELRKCKSDFKYWVDNYVILPDGYVFKDENGNLIYANKIILEKKKKEYPKTYEECCKVLNVAVRDFDILYNMLDTTETIYTNNLDRLLNSFRKLLICRDAYWKIAGEEMGLGKPWEPDWNDGCYVIFTSEDGLIKIDTQFGINVILAFPTEEMRDAFYENFKELIEQCKELL